MDKQTVAVFDFDKTISKSDTYIPFLLHALRRKPWRILSGLRLILPIMLYFSGVINNACLKRAFLSAFLKNEARHYIDELSENFAQHIYKNGLRKDAVQAIARHREQGHILIMASASFDCYIEKIARNLHFDKCVASKLEWSHYGTVTGELDGQNCYGIEKLFRIKEVLHDREGLHIVAYSDHCSDKPLLLWADKAFAISPSKTLAKEAAAINATIIWWN